MTAHYNIEWLSEKSAQGDALEFVFFWGHTAAADGAVDKACFSQWFPSPFVVDDIVYKTAEHWMMARKALLFNDQQAFNDIIKAADPADVKALGRKITGYNDAVWNANKFDLVKMGNIHKFNQHPALAAYLFSTGDKVIVEASPVDTIWGIGLAQDNAKAVNVQEWRGENLLGFALMEVRDTLLELGLFEPLINSLIPPWLAYPGKHPGDEFWSAGEGRKYVMQLADHFSKLDDRERNIYMLSHPQPQEWLEFYQ